MTRPGDTLVLFLLIGVIIYFVLRKLPAPGRKKKDENSIKGEIPDLLRSHGYEVVGAKERIPFEIDFNGRIYESRLFIDYLACRDDQWYIVIVSRQRKPVRESGAGLREFFLPYYLLYRPDAILYVDRDQGLIREIVFDIPDVSLGKKQNWTWLIFLAVALILIVTMVITS
ncbi:hypothetical protein [Thermoactinomyces mirandus]|uniref:Uncharacterized protein n=1 Tax=Thermoactinomyces mirandus TaxID=2756294 RepID=A0A7W1XPS1_9BACL|nr:hypothetical protein [Thermoactinomyces mirandus]MBA4600917.1 hypothetical protein [Thermoactinomyces mirandus]